LIVPLALKILGSVSAAALVGTGTLIAIPLLNPPPPDAWLDAPAAGSIVTEGDIPLSMHTNVDGVTYVRAVVSKDGAEDVVLTDTTPDTTSRGANALPLTWAVVAWKAAVGEYDVLVQTCAPGACWADGGTAHITVIAQGPPFAEMPDEGATEPDPIPTDDVPGDEPEDPGTDEPDPDPDPDPSEPAPDPTPTGDITQNFTDSAMITTWFDVAEITPSSTKVSVRVQVVPEGAGYDDSSWTTLKCPVSSGSCTTPKFNAGSGGGERRWGYYQLVLKNGTNVVEGPVEFWQLVR
jgi:hypothetical protein